MKKVCFIIIIGILSTSLWALPKSAGTGFSVYIPESLYLKGDGSVSLEQSLEFGIGLGGIMSMPIGVTYNTNYGLMVDGVSKVEHPWFYSDSIMPYIMLKAHIPLGPLYIELFGGGAGNYNFTLRPIEGNIEKDLSVGSSQAVFVDDSLKYKKAFGLGFLAGGSFGVNIGKISVDISVQYRSIWHNLDLTGEFSSISQVNSGQPYDSNATLMMRGLSVGIGGSFQL